MAKKKWQKNLDKGSDFRFNRQGKLTKQSKRDLGMSVGALTGGAAGAIIPLTAIGRIPDWVAPTASFVGLLGGALGGGLMGYGLVRGHEHYLKRRKVGDNRAKALMRAAKVGARAPFTDGTKRRKPYPEKDWMY